MAEWAIAWAGSTGPGGCGCADDGTTNANTHLHIFSAHRDETDNKWYFFDPYGIYSFPSCYPTAVNAPINTACARYPIAWKNNSPQYPTLSALADEPAEEIVSDAVAEALPQLLIAPNPSTGSITVKYNGDKAGKVNLVIYDKSGSAVFTKPDYAMPGNNAYHLNLSHLISGSYYLELSDNNNVRTRQKFIINR